MRNIIETEYLASMLAESGINVKFSDSVPTASYCPDNKELVMPAFAGLDKHLFDLLMAHEVGHALHGSCYPEGIPAIERAYINIIDDVRVDRLQRERYAGLKKDYFFGSKKMLEENIFQLDCPVSELALIDKINLHSKVGMHMAIPFSKKEQVFLTKAYNTSTMEDVITLAREIMAWEQKEQEKKEEQNSESESESNSTPDSSEFGSESSDSNSESGSVSDSNSNSESETNKENKENKDTATFSNSGTEDENDGDKSKGMGGRTTEGVPFPATSDKINSYVANYKEYNNHFSSDDRRIIGQADYKPHFGNAKAFRENIFEMFSPEKITQIGAYCYDVENWQNVVKKDFSELKSSVAILVRQFEMKKRARASVTLTKNKGDIDVNKLSLYRITDDIFFTRVQETIAATKHKIVMLLDCSGSMNSGGFQVIADKIAVLRGFCKTVNVPFEIIGFSSYNNNSNTVSYHDFLASKNITRHSDYRGCADYNHECRQQDKLFPLNGVFLLNILNEKDGDDYFARLYYALRYANSILTFCRWWRNDTPLNYAVNLCYSYLSNMKAQNPDTKLNFIVLTDGEASDYTYQKNVMVLHGKEYNMLSYTDEECRILDYQYILYKALKERGIANSIVKYHVLYSWHSMIANRDVFLIPQDYVDTLGDTVRTKKFANFPIQGKLKECLDRVYFIYNSEITASAPFRFDENDLSKRYIKEVKKSFHAVLNKSAINKAIAGDIVNCLI